MRTIQAGKSPGEPSCAPGVRWSLRRRLPRQLQSVADGHAQSVHLHLPVLGDDESVLSTEDCMTQNVVHKKSYIEWEASTSHLLYIECCEHVICVSKHVGAFKPPSNRGRDRGLRS